MNEVNLYAMMFLIFVFAQKSGEMIIARANTKRLIAHGAVEYGAGHYPFMFTLHTCWVLAIIMAGHSKEIIFAWLAVYGALQGFKFWILITLGERWTNRIIVTDEPLIRYGPYRYFKHPGYMLTVVEIFVAPMVLGLGRIALAFTVLNAVMLFVRIHTEEKALAHLRHHD